MVNGVVGEILLIARSRAEIEHWSKFVIVTPLNSRIGVLIITETGKEQSSAIPMDVQVSSVLFGYSYMPS